MKIDVLAVRVAAGEQVEVEFDATVSFSAKVDSGGTCSGSWHPVRTLRLVASARDGTGTGWGEARVVDHSIENIVPSCFLPTLIAYNGMRGKLVVAPDRDDAFDRGPTDSMWSATSTPDLLLADEGSYTLVGYDERVVDGGSFAVGEMMDITGQAFAALDGLQRVHAAFIHSRQCRHLLISVTTSTRAAGATYIHL
ncbi:hypothetical protein ACVWYQ_003434 [Bradyrhizobium sp. USDA 3397]